MTVAEELKAEGEARGEARALLRQLTFEFGDLPDSITATVHDAPSDTVRQWTLRVLTATSVEEVFEQ